MAAKETVIVTLSDEAAGQMDKTTRALEHAGLEVTGTLSFLGQVTGSCQRGQRAALGAVPGVVSVEESGEVRLPPPGSNVQ